MKKALVIITFIAAISFNRANAQFTQLTSPVGVGISWANGDLHIHESVSSDPVLPPSPDGGRDFSSYYVTTLRMTNTVTTASEYDGFVIEQCNNRVTLRQYEKDELNIFANNGSGITIDSVGRIGIGGGPNTAYRLNVTGNTRMGGNAVLTGSVTASNGTFSGGLAVAGNTALGNGFTCSYDGKVRAKEVRVTLEGWSDFVFDNGYRLPPLSEIEKYVRQNRHLPDIPTEAEAIGNGVDLGEMNARLLQKIEELTLYVIDLQKQIDQLKTEKKPLDKVYNILYNER